MYSFANGVADLIPRENGTGNFVWNLANRSNNITQALNVAAIFSAPIAVGMTKSNLSTMLCHNLVAEGLPHHATSLPKVVRNQSLTHQMTSLARRALIKRIGVPPAHAEAILAATIMHSADHYYCDFYMGHDCRSTFLTGDFTRFRETVISPNKYRTSKLLCRQHLEDPICKILYECCRSIDPVFAKDALFMAVAS